MSVVKMIASFLFIMVMLNSQAFAGENWKTVEGRGYGIVEVMSLDLDSLNNSLKDNGYGTLSNKLMGVGIGGYSIAKNNILVEGYAVIYSPVSSKAKIGMTEYESTLTGFTGTYNVGYNAYNKNRLRILPLAGITFGTLKLTNKEQNKRDFSDLLSTPKDSVIETEPIIVLNFAVDFNWQFRQEKIDFIRKNIGLGFRLGYRHDIGKKTWQDVSNGPELSFSGPYINMTFGGGYIKYEK